MPDTRCHITKLKNGLIVAIKEIHTAPVASVWIWYKVGSRDEVAGITGVSHFLEHMAAIRFYFNGTPFFPLIDRLGGATNAMTSLDFTTYYATVPSYQTDIVLRAFARQMGGQGRTIHFGEADQERTVIVSERQGLENEPIFRLSESIQQIAFRVHSYHHEVIGDMADLRTMTCDDVYNHYRTFYVPNNAVMAVAGDFDTKSMLARIKELFGLIPAGKVPPRLSRQEPEQKGEIRLTIEGPGETAYVQVAYRFPNASHPDFFPLAVLDSLLVGPSNLNMFGGGISNKTSRLYRALVDKEYVVGISGNSAVTIDPFLYTFTLIVHPKRKPEAALAALDVELQKMQDELVSKIEIARAIKQARAIFAYGSENITNQAFWLGYAEMFSNYDWFLSYLEQLSKVTVKDVQRVAREYFKPSSRVVGTYVPTGNGEAANG